MKFIILLFVLSLNLNVLAWGPLGHRIVGKIAQNHLSKDTEKKVKKLLSGQTLYDVANWADLIRSDVKWNHAAYWHYVSIEDSKTYKSTKPNSKGDIISAINEKTKELKNSKTSFEKKQQAIKFLVHFIGDFQMPLHVGRKSDKGGNNISIRWFSKKTNLHAVWDSEIIEMEHMSFSEYADYLQRRYGDKSSKYLSLNLNDWVKENMAYRQLIYDLPPLKKQKNWEYDYRFKTMDVANLQLYKGGIRLAEWLNTTLKDVKL